MNKLLDQVRKNQLLYILLLCLVLLTFLIQAFIYAHQMPSRVDEGSFLIKGYYYVKGIYKPFQDYGPWTNNMPLAYYIPGLAQALFGPGLKTGRYFAIIIAQLILLAMWMLVRREKGKWWALFSLLFFALNPALIKIYIQALSQVIVACLVAWMLYFLVSEKRSQRQIALGSFFCALAILTRQNMIFLLPFVILYAYFLFGKKAGRTALLWSCIPILLVHILFFPKINNLWYSWLPRFIKDLMNIVVIPGGGTQVWTTNVGLLTRFTSFFTALRYYFVPFLGLILVLILLPRKDVWTSAYERKLAKYLSVLFTVMFLLHAWASLAKNYCVYCFPNYLAFFIPIAVYLATMALANANEFKPRIRLVWPLALVLIFIPGAFLGSLETVGRWVMALDAPRLKDGRILSGSTELWKLFENRFGFTYDQILPGLSVAFGFGMAILFLLLIFLVIRVLRRKNKLKAGNTLFTALVILGIVLMPSPLLGQMQTTNTCGGDVLTAYEKVGSQLAETIPADSTVYWGAGSVVTPLLYLPDVYVYPQLLNGVYSKRVGGDRDLLEKNGYYNQESVEAWRLEADYIINSNLNMTDKWINILTPDAFDEYQHTDMLDPCEPDSYLRIFKRK